MVFVIITLIKIALIAFVFLTALAYLQWVERKVIAHIQVRMGPSRVGPHGLLQPLADVIKLITKEDLLPPHVNSFFYLLAPFLAVFMALISISVIPFGPQVTIGPYTTMMQLTDLNVGVLFILAISAMGVYGIALAGWSSNNKYSLLGGLRSSAQMISYELPMSLAIAAPLLMLNTLSLRGIVDAQAATIFGIHSEMAHLPGAVPADLQLHHFHDRGLRGNQPHSVRSAGSGERTGGRLPHRIQQHEVRRVLHGRVRQHGDGLLRRDAAVPGRLASAVSRRNTARTSSRPLILFDRRRDLLLSRAEPGAPLRPLSRCRSSAWSSSGSRACCCSRRCVPVLMPLFWFLAKIGFLLFVFIWIRATLPRFRYDQLMSFAWNVCFPRRCSICSSPASWWPFTPE